MNPSAPDLIGSQRWSGGFLRRAEWLVVSCALGALLFAAPAAWARAPVALACGDTLTKDTKLAADLDCPNLSVGESALTLSGANTTLNLNGHAIRGPGQPSGPFVAGVSVTGTRDTVRGGTITGFGTDLFEFNSDAPGLPAAVVLRRLTLTDAAIAVEIEGNPVTVAQSTISGVDTGIVSETGGQRIERDAITANGNAGDPTCGGGTCRGIVLADGSGALIRNSTISSLGTMGIALAGRFGADTVKHNTISCQDAGPPLTSGCLDLSTGEGGSVVARNSVSAASGDGIEVLRENGDTLTANTASGSTNGSGIVVSEVNDATVVGNTASDNGVYGLLVDGDGNLIERNTANGNHLDGIRASGANTLTANTARDNGGLGTEALGGAIDGGRNRASGNAEPQCVGVICRP